jgi:hypothetical protein
MLGSWKAKTIEPQRRKVRKEIFFNKKPFATLAP